MRLKMVMPLGKICIVVLALSGCKVPDGNNQADKNEQNNLYRTDTVSVLESEDALLEVGLRNLTTGKKHGLWYYYEGSKLVRIESFQEGVENGPMVQFATGDDGKTGIHVIAYIANGEFEGPAIRINADSTLNYYNYYVKGHSVNSLYIDEEGSVEVKLNDSTYRVGSIPIKE